MIDYSTISIDKGTKNRASKRAKKDRITVSMVTRILLNDYADGKITIGSQMAVTENGFTPEQERDILIASDEASRGVNVTKAMSPKEALTYLETL